MIKAHPDQPYGNITYSQHGEDFLIVDLFKRLGINKPSYLDIGAHHPHIISNTHLLYTRGSRGVNVEANPRLIEAFFIHRPEDININYGVMPEAGMYPFYLYSSSSGRNTFNKDEMARFLDEETTNDITDLHTQRIECRTLADIIEHACKGVFPNFLNLDIEGYDYGVLDSYDFNFDNSPDVICVEVRNKDIHRMCTLMEVKGFSRYLRIGENEIFIQPNHAKKLWYME